LPSASTAAGRQTRNVGTSSKSGNLLLVLRLTEFDPDQTSRSLLGRLKANLPYVSEKQNAAVALSSTSRFRSADTRELGNASRSEAAPVSASRSRPVNPDRRRLAE